MDLAYATAAPVMLATYDDRGLLASLVIGLIIGAIAKLLMPGRDPGGCLITILLGLAGSFVGTLLGRLLFGEQYVAGWIGSVIGAMLLLWLYRVMSKRNRF